jgi:hypothetical protein
MQAAEAEGFNRHARGVIGERDVAGCERLLRDTARTAVALDRETDLLVGHVA